MKLAKPVTIALVCALSSGLFGCTPAKKVHRTLSLNNLHMQAGVAESRGDDQRAYELWSEYIERRPQSAMVEYRLGKVETRLGLYDQAAGHLRVAYDLQPANIEYLEALCDALLLGGRVDSMMKLLHETVSEGEPGSGLLRLAHYAQKAGQMDEAREALILAIAKDQGGSVLPYLAMADFSRDIGDVQGEIQYLRQVLWFAPSDPDTLNRLEELGMIPGPSLAVDPRN